MCECVCVCAAVRVGDEIAKIGKHPNRRLLYSVKTQIVDHNGHQVSAMYVVGIPMKTFLILDASHPSPETYHGRYAA